MPFISVIEGSFGHAEERTGASSDCLGSADGRSRGFLHREISMEISAGVERNFRVEG